MPRNGRKKLLDRRISKAQARRREEERAASLAELEAELHRAWR